MVAIPMLSLLFAISFKFSPSKKVIFNRFCCFLFLNYDKKVRLLLVMRLMPKAGVGNLLPMGWMRPSRHFTRPATFFLFLMIDMQQ